MPESLQSKPLHGHDSTTLVQLPDLFILFLSEAPAVNPHYANVKGESEKWIAETCCMNDRSRKILTKTNFALFLSIAAPEARVEELRTLFDWGNWVFPFDDMFDNGHLKDDVQNGQIMIDALMHRMRDDKAELPAPLQSPLIDVHNSVWERVVEGAPRGVQKRFARAMADYSHGVISQVEVCSSGENVSLEEVLALRRHSAGVSPLFPLIEYAHRLRIPDQVFECPSIKEIERVGIDFVVLQNDILSYWKEEKEGVIHNLVAVCRNAGMSAQAAFDHLGYMLQTRYRDWYLALASLPSWGNEIDAEVQNYIRGVQNVVKANLHWSFSSGRYFGDAVHEVRKTKKIRVQKRETDFIPRGGPIDRVGTYEPVLLSRV
ncbi:terpene cyclase [Penicillium chermesinum]|uniref:Terpene synthase n=1 Tax=Penicillium chermesinum TaxID=63820 RepID=A0A9W9PKK6_9EURO|nr:terpene cyclase [Penicillium chermesinum]KAJ5247787.1 terpene cyclase [Penicillium chermesinum]KAJ6151549.1 terpene cyclase [Penicillium chermesinum]